MSNDTRNVKIRLAGLWQHTDSNGNLYFSGTIGQARLLILPNSFKKPGEKTPDFNVYLAPREVRPLAGTQVTDTYPAVF